ncbi:hypothetical protein KFL_000790260 [Klebsormidium nitens]|uniref:Mitochondrial inner membrane translocase subunit Tim17/Tim22/Tim23/peroxisomal protein PMP24 n=1 Tax=Klebsormidium nitens TaxID=105231 RepID=A0A1Y1HWP8_KLENI|nr:hypothetical protein KFL_000790260 [Klebsormidium nitens]|eukprot:GAQ81401.1 hypothetical protein KFL_000790260 [Klebsormidium nitens]
MPPGHRRNRPHNEGWQGRLLNRTLGGAGVGMLGGSLVALYKGRPVSTYTLTVGLNAAIATACCCGATEAVREVRHGMDGWQNALVGSAISGAFLGRFWGGPSRVLPFAFSFGVLGVAASFASDQLHEYKIRRALVNLETEETESGKALHCLDDRQDGSERRKEEESAPSMWDWLPVRRASEDEIRRRENKVEESLASQKQRENNGH